MELLAILRILWDRRVIVGLGGIVAVAVGRRAGQGAAAPPRAVGSMSMMLDTTDSQLVEAAAYGTDQLPKRAALLADGLTSDSATATIAREAGVPDGQLAVLGPSARQIPQVDTPLVSDVYAVASTASTPYVVNVLADQITPIVKIDAQAPNGQKATRLIQASRSVLRSLLLRDDGEHSHGFVLDTVVPLRTKPAPAASSHRRLMMAGAAVAVFGTWC